MSSGKLIIISAPSGSGKTTIVRHLLSIEPRLEFSISATSRAPREGETDGEDYYFLSADTFRDKIDKGEFTEWEEVYKDHYYGTLNAEIKRIWEKGDHVIFDVDVVGGLNLKKKFGSTALSFFVMPPSLDELRNRLIKRATDTERKIEMRVSKAAEEIELVAQFDHVIINDDLDLACKNATELVTEFLDRDN